MKKIPLTKGKFALVDDEDFDRVNQWKWCALTARQENSFYAIRRVKTDGKPKYILLHNEVMNSPDGFIVDHFDDDGLNNQKSNLRVCTYSQNGMRARRINMHGFRGVCFLKNRDGVKPWMVQINIGNGKRLRRYFTSLINAAIGYNILAMTYQREFARLNPVPFTY